MFRLGSGLKFRGSVSPSGAFILEIRQPDAWYPVTAPDLQAAAMQALALAAIGAPPSGFAFTTDERFTESVTTCCAGNYAQCNPFRLRAAIRYGCFG